MYDAIVVGARCAGSPTAMLLARAGHRVLMVDRGSFPPGDKPMSTHLLHPPAILRLREWGLLGQVVASGCPPIREYGFVEGALDFMAPLPPIEDVAVAYAPRRRVLDPILWEAAAKAGVEMRDGVSVSDLLWDGDRVVGIRARSREGSVFEERARVVVGADGTNSLVARKARAAEYRGRGHLTRGVWTYWADLPVPDVPTFRAGGRYVFAWPTNDELTLVGIAWRAREYPESGPEEAYLTALHRTAPSFAERVRQATRAERWLRGGIPNFFRKPYGPGWALVGDAAYSKDPCTAQGISDAFRDADSVARALHEGLSGQRDPASALAAHEARRNAHAFPYYDYTCDFAGLDPYPPEVIEMLCHAAGDGRTMSSLVGMFGQTFSPADFFSSAGMKSLIASLDPRDGLGWKLRLARWLWTGPGARNPASHRVGERLIAQKLGGMAHYLNPA